LLGGVRLTDATTEHTRLATRAITALLARLALWPLRDHPREELIELLWPGVDLAVGRRRLRQALSLLRAVLEPPQSHLVQVPVLRADWLSVRVVPDTIVCDVHSFEAQCRHGHRDAALASYRGEFMPGFFDAWIHDERLRLSSLYEQLAAAPAQGAGRRATAVPAGHTATSAFAASAPPSAPPAPPQRAGVGLPGYLTRYFSNAAQSQRLLHQVLQHRLVTVLGPGGSGKTRLAVDLAGRFRRRDDGPLQALAQPPFALVLFVPLASAQTREQLLAALQTALQIGTESTVADSLLARLEGARALLVLDNAEQLAGIANGLIEQLTAALPGLHLLVTSRCPLGVYGEREFPIEPLPVPPAGASLQQAAASPAVVLFVDRACAVRADFHLSARNQAAIVDLVRALEGMPLAIELAASRIRAFSPAEMLGKLRRLVLAPGDTPGLELLSRPGQHAAQTSRHASMQRTIEWSWLQLSADQQLLAAAMAEFPGGCDASMLAGMQGGSHVAAALEQLHGHSLIHAQGLEAESGAAPRFQLYEPIREYAAAQFDAGHGLRWRARQRAWALAWLQALPATPPLAGLRAELSNLAAAFASAAADAAGADAVGLLLALHPSHEGVTLPAQTLAQASTAVLACEDASLRSRGCSALAPLLFTAGDTPQACLLADAAVDAAPPRGPVRAWALLAWGWVHWRGALSPPDQVLPRAEQALGLAEDIPDPDLLAAALCLLALVRHGCERDPEAARALVARAQSVWEAAGNRHGVNLARHNVAVFDFHCGRREQALAAWDAISAEASVLQDTRRVAIANSARCAALSDMRRWPQALQALRESLRQSWQGMRLYDVSYDLWNLPRVLAHLRQPETALCLMAFAAQFWQSRFGSLTVADRRHLRMVERLAARQLDARAGAAAAARGRQMPLAEAVALALGD
jgi:predicted ATPase